MANYPFPQISPAKIRSYFLRMPIFTRAIIAIIVACYIASFFTPIQDYASLKPDLIELSSLGRISSYPFVHDGFFHTFLNLIALVPLLERFEAENGTLVSLLLFFGPFCTLPGIIYVLIEHIIFRGDTAVMGASIWVFLLLANEAIKTFRSNPYFTISTYHIPTWTTPVFLMLAISFLVPRTSLIGHLCGALIGYLWGLGYLKVLVPPEKLTRWLEEKLQLLQRVPHYVSVDQKTYGRYGVLPSVSAGGERRENGTPMSTFLNQPPQRVGP